MKAEHSAKTPLHMKASSRPPLKAHLSPCRPSCGRPLASAAARARLSNHNSTPLLRQIDTRRTARTSRVYSEKVSINADGML